VAGGNGVILYISERLLANIFVTGTAFENVLRQKL
jgi:hypothetical protein